MRPFTPRHARTVLLASALVLVACAGVDDESGATTPDATPAAVPGGGAPDASAILDLVHPDRAEPPAELGIVDLTVGDGDAATAGDLVVVQYWGLRWSDGGTFDASWERGQPFAFQLGAGQVIQGWELGVDGMQPGGRRVLTIPPALAYGDRGAGGVIGPGETLVFIVDLVETKRP
jgi:peptidylprolyl isomerase